MAMIRTPRSRVPMVSRMSEMGRRDMMSAPAPRMAAPMAPGMAKGGKTYTMAKGGSFGDPTKLTGENFSNRAKRSVLRGDDKGTYKKGGSTSCYAGGGMVDRAAVRGKTKGKIY